MPKKKVILQKVRIEDAVNSGIQSVIVPKYEDDQKVLKKIKGEFLCEISKYRNLEHHSKLFSIFRIAIANDIFAKLLDNKRVFVEEEKLLTFQYIHAILMQKKDMIDALLYILKWLFLPLDKEVLPDGNVSSKVSSIAFTEMDQVEFEEFYEKCVDFLSFKLNMTVAQLERIL